MPETPSSEVWLPPEFQPGLVSVVIPTYNRKQLIQESLASVFAQEYPAMEVIVVDDGSTDGTVRALREAEVIPGIPFRLIEQIHAGASASRNAGARVSRGEYLMFVDSDDILHTGAIEALVRGMADADLSFGQWRDWFSTESPVRFSQAYRRVSSGDLLTDILRDGWLLPSAVMHRRSSLLRCTGWDEAYGIEDDFEFMTRIAIGGARVSGVMRLVADYRRHRAGQLSISDAGTKSRVIEGILRRVEGSLSEDDWTPQRRAALAWRWYIEARHCWLNGDRERYRLLLCEARRVDPSFRFPKAWYRAIAAVAGNSSAERVAAIGRWLFR